MSQNQNTDSLYEYDTAVRNECNHIVLCGVDEAGRGPLAGDVFAAAVIFDDSVRIEGINDSKKLTEKKRNTLYDEIIQNATAYCIARATVDEIETLNILQASMLAMKRAVEGLGVHPDLVMADGNKCPDIPDTQVRAVIKGDAYSASIAAASILAKVSRDRYMEEMSELYPMYCFDKHKGYGTKLHYEKIDKFGPSEIHRLSFLRKYYEKKGTGE